MDVSELRAAVDRAQDAANAIARDLDGATAAQRSALEVQLRRAQDEAERASTALDDASRAEQLRLAQKQDVEVNGFGGNDLTREEARGEAIDADRASTLKDPERVSEPKLVSSKLVYQGGRFNAYTGLSNKIVETHTDPVALEIARAKAVSARVEQDRDAARIAAQEKSEAERKDMDRAAFEYEGLPQNRGITRERYAAADKEWKEHLDANPERRAALAEQQRDSYMQQRAITSGVPHREAQPGEKIEGKVVGVKSFEGVKHTVIETTEPPPQRVVVAGEVKGVQLGKEVQVTTDGDRRVHESRALVDRDERNTGRSR